MSLFCIHARAEEARQSITLEGSTIARNLGKPQCIVIYASFLTNVLFLREKVALCDLGGCATLSPLVRLFRLWLRYIFNKYTI